MNIVAIGGGDVGSGETRLLDLELIKLSSAARPKVLFIPTASIDDELYVLEVKRAFDEIGCDVLSLRLWTSDSDPEAAERKIRGADVVYVGGGNTKAMLARWREVGVDRMLRDHLKAGKPAGGLSAGAICWFRVGNSDWPQYEGIDGVSTARLDCMGLVDLVLCPHTAREAFRLDDFREMMRDESGVGIGLDDCCAIQVQDDHYRILSCQPGAVAHRIEWIGDRLNERVLEPHEDFRPLSGI